MKYIYTTVFFLCFTSISVFGQSLAILSVTFQDSVNFGETLILNAIIQNTDSLLFSDSITINVGYDSAGTISTIATKSQLIDSLPATDSVNIGGIQVPITTPQFSIGGNVVIVWPVAPSLVATDSLYIEVNVLDTATGIYSFGNISPKTISLFPNPSQGVVSIQKDGIIFIAERVRIHSISGQVVKEVQKSSSIDFSTLPKGAYLVEVKLDETSTQTFQIIRSH